MFDPPDFKFDPKEGALLLPPRERSERSSLQSAANADPATTAGAADTPLPDLATTITHVFNDDGMRRPPEWLDDDYKPRHISTYMTEQDDRKAMREFYFICGALIIGALFAIAAWWIGR